MNKIQAGETFTFEFQISGGELEALTANMTVLQFPGDTPTVSRALTLTGGRFTGTLTSAETQNMYDTGNTEFPWLIHNQTTDADEDVREIIKLYVGKNWV